MYSAGIDVGFAYIKVVICEDNQILASAKTESGGADRKENVKAAFLAACESAGLSSDAVEQVIATGKGKTDVDFADKRISEAVAAGCAAKALVPGATSILNVGADETLAVSFDADGNIQEWAINQKCSAGIGLLIERTCSLMELDLPVFDQLPEKTEVILNEGCPVFCDLDVLELLNKGVDRLEILRAVTEAMAVRVSSVWNDLTFRNDEKPVLTGGLALISPFVQALKARSGCDFVVPNDADLACAFGAAIYKI